MRVNENGVLIACRYEVRANLALISKLKLKNLKDNSISTVLSGISLGTARPG
ncbi:MAG: hypothetical protein LBH57_09895 [Treponema sp.]|jgi:hypothetical protein|nr:hypothetical protein [Treponema sp.]